MVGFDSARKVNVLGRFPQPNALIGMIALPPLPGCDGHPGMPTVVQKALADLATLEAVGFDGVLVENDDDRPHRIGVDAEIRAAMTDVIGRVVAAARVPVGLEILYDMAATVDVAHETGAAFVRLDVFADAVETRWGIVPACADEIATLCTRLGADDLLLFTDAHVKHARLLSERTLEDSIADSLAHGSDGIIVTGDWTGNPPTIADCQVARAAAGDAPVIIGSGLTPANAADLLAHADAAIVGTAISTDGAVDAAKATALVAAVERLRPPR